MDKREPLPIGYCLCIENVGRYIIKELIGKGGFSLVYEAEIPGGTTQFVIKEYYPSNGTAFRNEKNMICPHVGFEDSFSKNLDRFNQEGVIGGQIANCSSQTVSFLICRNGYAVMKKESNDMISIADLEKHWLNNPPLPCTGEIKDIDPVFSDLVRLKYSLHVIESVLSVLSVIHKEEKLHLDLNYRNVLWAGADQDTGRNCFAIIADYGCSVPLSGGVYQPKEQSPTSEVFAAPELKKDQCVLNPSTDIYSVGMLLFFLCVGEDAFESSCNIEQHVAREIDYLGLPRQLKQRLWKVIFSAIRAQESRYQSVFDMQKDIRKLFEDIPTHPITPDNTKAFTLYSLKSMLEGSLGTQYSWAHELRDRQNTEIDIPDEICQPICDIRFNNDIDFLGRILPENIFGYLSTCIANSGNPRESIRKIMCGNYDPEWRAALIEIIKRNRARRFVQCSSTLLKNEPIYISAEGYFIRLIDNKDARRITKCHLHCRVPGYTDSQTGLALITLYALLGSDGFRTLVPAPAEPNLFLVP